MVFSQRCRRGLALLATWAGLALGQTNPPALADEFKLAEGSYAAALDLPSLNLRAPPGTLRLKTLQPVRGIHAADLRAFQETIPANYGTRCVGVLDLTLVPVGVGAAPALVEGWARETDALVLSRDLARATFLRGPPAQPVLSMVRAFAGAVLIASCPVAEVTQPSGALLPSAQRAASATLAAFNWYGAVALCRADQELPVWNVRAFEGAVQQLTRTPDATLIAAVGWDLGGPALKLFRPPAQVPMARTPLSGTPRMLFVSGNGQRVTLLSQDNAASPNSVVLRVDAATGQQQARLVLPPGEQARAVSNDGVYVAATTGVSGLRVREVLGGKLVWSGRDSRVVEFAFAQGDRWLVGVDKQGRLMSWRTDSGDRGPSVQLTAANRTMLRPGPGADQLSVLTVQGTSMSAPGTWSAATWTVGVRPPAPQGQVQLTGGDGLILGAETGQPQVVRLCDTAAGLPLPLSRP